MTPCWLWCLISGLMGLMLGWGIAEELSIREFRKYIRERNKRDNEDLKRKMEGK